MAIRIFVACYWIAVVGAGLCHSAERIQRVLPPAGIELSAQDRGRLDAELRIAQAAIEPLRTHPRIADAAVFVKAVDFALQHGEFYQPKDVDRALDVLGRAQDRAKHMAAGTTPWAQQRGRIVRGFTSRIDGSPQPYGLLIPEDLDLAKPAPLYVWLHGRGDKQTDLHFIAERLNQDGQIKPSGAIVLHPFGRHCLGFKSAGETDVLEAIADVASQYAIDSDRIVLMGFSMGGAGAWHLGAHYTDRFVAISPGAGFAETARYTNLKPENYPPRYEQTLWGCYDVPNYARNLFNRPVIAYSGELDKQIQAARVMEEAYREHGRTLPHLIGPGMGHKYHPDTLKDLLGQIAVAVKQGRPRQPKSVSLQTRTLRYPRVDWVEALRLGEHWQDARIDARRSDDGPIAITTRNVTALRLAPEGLVGSRQIDLDQELVPITFVRDKAIEFVRDGKWRLAKSGELNAGLTKRSGLQGPIDDAFLDSFLVAVPSGRATHPAVQAWIEAELDHFRARWSATFRGTLREKPDTAITDDDLRQHHIVAWGTPESNAILNRAAAVSTTMPVTRSKDKLAIGEQSFAAANHVAAFIYPNPLAPSRYLVVNSGPTFREAHDRTNSQQNPKLPDWAIIDVSQPPSDHAPGRIAAAGFFDERWQVKK